MCQECEDAVGEANCPSCEQTLCQNCDKVIHNKGKRAQHSRVKLDSTMNLEHIQGAALVTIKFITQLMDSQDLEKVDSELKALNDFFPKELKGNIIVLILDDSDQPLTKLIRIWIIF
jgi:hypothetical protein